ncbi:MAG: hypothetical protein Q9207_004500 [Kuettlingeria erythrocarpa]
MKNGDPNVTFLKVTDTDTGAMIAQAKLNVYDWVVVPEAVDLDGGGYWANDEDKEYARHLLREYLAPRRKAIEELSGRLTVVEASDYAYRLYGSEKFVFKQDYVIPLPEKWAGRKRQKFKWMVRPVNSGGVDDKPAAGQ